MRLARCMIRHLRADSWSGLLDNPQERIAGGLADSFTEPPPRIAVSTWEPRPSAEIPACEPVLCKATIGIYAAKLEHLDRLSREASRRIRSAPYVQVEGGAALEVVSAALQESDTRRIAGGLVRRLVFGLSVAQRPAEAA